MADKQPLIMVEFTKDLDELDDAEFDTLAQRRRTQHHPDPHDPPPS